jgi:RNA polymerase sigma-70 factor (ECF subfamily)
LNPADEALVLNSQHGDRAAFEELVRRTARLVFSRIYLETGDMHRCEDLVQDTFLSAWRRIGQVSDPAGFRAWLLTVAHSVTIDAQRRDLRKKRAGTHVNESALAAVASAGPAPPETAAKNEARDRVLSILRGMPDEYRQPLMLRYFAGADYQTIERQLGISNGSLRGLLARGMERMRTALGDS